MARKVNGAAYAIEKKAGQASSAEKKGSKAPRKAIKAKPAETLAQQRLAAVNDASFAPSEPGITNTVRNVCVYCGSGSGNNPAFAAAAVALGTSLAQSNIGLVYGGGGLGLMGEVARSVLQNGGRVTGIIPTFLSTKERMLVDVQELILTNDMHERKRLMFERSDAFVALPGGIGTLEELIEQLTWSQLGRHKKPIVVANINDFWAPMLKLLAHMRDQAFIRPGLEVGFIVVDRAEDIVPAILAAAKGVTTDDGVSAAVTARF